MKIGYARVSSTDQDLTTQREALETYGCDVIRAETASGTKRRGREELATVIEFLREGDQLVVVKLDRLARDLGDLLNICLEIEGHGASLAVIDQHIDTSTAAGKAFFHMLGVFAEFENNIRRERQRDGIERAKALGKYKGRKPSAKLKAGQIKALAKKGKQKAAIARELGVSRSSVYRALNEEGHGEDAA